jgi:hypothetical protein
MSKMRYAKLGYKAAVSAFNHDQVMSVALAALTPAERAGTSLEVWIDDANKRAVWRIGHETSESERISRLDKAVAQEDDYEGTLQWAARNNVLFIEG